MLRKACNTLLASQFLKYEYIFIERIASEIHVLKGKKKKKPTIQEFIILQKFNFTTRGFNPIVVLELLRICYQKK